MRYFVLLLIFSTTLFSCSTTRRPVTNVQFAKNPVIAHRGAFKKNNLPENSIASLREAIRLGCTGSEFDVRMSADDSLLINHDPHYHNLEIEKTSYSELAKFPLSNGEILPTLRQYLSAGLANNRGTRLVVEIKPSASKERGKLIAEKVLRLVSALHAENMVVYISFDYDILKKIREINANAPTQYLNGDRTPEQLKEDGINGADYHLSVFKKNPDWVERSKKAGIILNAWTVNTQEDMQWLLDRQFDYITTNEPELLLTLRSFTIKGKLPQSSTAEKVYLQNSLIDTALPLSANKEFYYKGTLSQPDFFFIKTDKSYAWGIWIESGDINVSLEEYPLENADPSAKKLIRITALSGPAETEKNEWFVQQQNSLARRFQGVTREQFQDSMIKYFDPLVEDYIRNHPDSKFSAFISRRAFGKENQQKFLSLVNRELTTEDTRRLETTRNREKATAVGTTIDNFKMKDINGKTISLNGLSSQYILLDFWASWCGPCRSQHPELRKIYDKFRNKSFEIVSVSLDDSKADWRKAVEQDQLSWIHVSELKGWENALAKRFFVDAIPFNILIDKNRKIIATSLHPAALAEKLQELLKQSP